MNKAPLKHHSCTTETQLQTHLNNIVIIITALKHHCSTTETMQSLLKHHCSTTETPLQHYWNTDGSLMKHYCIMRETQSLLHLSKNCYFDIKLLIASCTFPKKKNDFITFLPTEMFSNPNNQTNIIRFNKTVHHGKNSCIIVFLQFSVSFFCKS